MIQDVKLKNHVATHQIVNFGQFSKAVLENKVLYHKNLRSPKSAVFYSHFSYMTLIHKFNTGLYIVEKKQQRVSKIVKQAKQILEQEDAVRTSKSMIVELKPKEVFVFGSNLAGRHGAGAARLACDKFGALYGIGKGFWGKSYAIPTKDEKISTLPLEEIQSHVTDFINEVKALPASYKWLVTEIGCGLAGLTPEQIAPMFKEAMEIDNIHLPASFWKILKDEH